MLPAEKALTLPLMLKHRFFKTKDVKQMQMEATGASGTELRKTLTWIDLIFLGVGFM